MTEHDRRIAVDRIESDRAILTIGTEQLEVPVACLPEGATEGTLLLLQVAPAEDIQTEAEARLERLRQRTPKVSGPIDL